MTGKRTFGLLALLLAALVTTGYGQTAVVGNFEGSLDGWYTDTWTAGTIALSATGATVGTGAMEVSAPGGYKQCTKASVKSQMAILANKYAKITAEVTAFAADTTSTWMQVGMVLNCQGDDGNGANNNIGWQDLGTQGVALDGKPHKLIWWLSDALTTKIAGADDKIGWFETLLISNVDGAATAKFYVDNIKVSYEASAQIGDFESGLDGWFTDQWVSGAVALSDKGATVGTGTMEITGPGGWKAQTKIDAKSYLADLANKGASVTMDVTAFAADTTSTWMQVGLVLNAQGDDGSGANNNIGWNDFGTQGVALDGKPHRLTWWLPDALTGKIAGADDKIGWFELEIVSNVDGAATAKFYVDNIRIFGLPLAAPAAKATDFILGNFEQQLDGWVVGGGADVRYSDTNGVTLDKYSLDVWIANGAWNQDVLVMNLLDPNNAAALAAFKSNTKLSVDVTRLVRDWPVDDIPGWNEIIMIVNAGGDGWSMWETVGKLVSWKQTDGDKTLTAVFDYAPYLARMNLDNMTWCELHLGINANDASYAGWVWFYLDNMKLIGGGTALYPKPANAAIDVDINTQLSWSGGAYAAKHNVYLGTDRGAVTTADGAGNASVTFTEVDGASFDPTGLEFNTEYFWRVDAVNDVNPDSPWKGATWSFKTANAIVVDDFESYTDAPGAEVFSTWADGVGTDEIAPNGTGAMIGLYPDPINGTFCDTTTVHGGKQSMPLHYENTPFTTSEAIRTWAAPQDWTRNGYDTMSLYVHGKAANGVDPLYLIIKDSDGKTATKTCDIATILTAEDWTLWEFPTSDLAGVDLTKVIQMTIGVGNPQGGPSKAIGNVLIDDIQIGVKPMGLVAYYKLEGNLLDSSGNGHDGTFGGDASRPAKFVAGPTGFGQGLLFDKGVPNQCVELGTFNPSIATGKLTVALWAKWEGLSGQWQGLIGKRDGWAADNMMWDIEIHKDDGTIQFRRNGSNGVPAGQTLQVGTWTHLAATFDGTTARFYINGTEAGSASFTFGSDTEAALHFGTNDTAEGNSFNGSLDEVRIYDKALTATEVKALLTPQ
jgi:hypothetical protein